MHQPWAAHDAQVLVIAGAGIALVVVLIVVLIAFSGADHQLAARGDLHRDPADQGHDVVRERCGGVLGYVVY